MNKIVSVIVTYNIGKSFIKTINSLENQVDEIVVVDNGSNKDTIQMLLELKDKVTLIQLNKNNGIAYALNRGIEYCINKNYDWILTLDHDSVLYKNMINDMLNNYNEFPEDYKNKIAMLVPTHIEEKEFNNIEKYKNGIEEVLTEITSGSLVKSEIYTNIGRYNENLFIDLVDHDYCLFLNKLGFKIVRIKSALLKHNLGEMSKYNIFGIVFRVTNHSPMRRYYMTRNRLYIWKKYKKYFGKWVINDKKKFMSETLKIIIFETDKLEKIKMICKGIKDYYTNKNLFNKESM